MWRTSPAQRAPPARELMHRLGKITAATAVALGALAIRTYIVRYGVASADNSSPTSASRLAHLDHSPRHGGLVLMNGDTHFEVVLDSGGYYSVYFTDAVRAPLPASVASEVHLAVTQAGRSPDLTVLQVDPTLARWIGRGAPIEDPDAIVRVAYTAEEKPYWIDVPVSAWSGLSASLPQ
jgi:hypothetical protein